MRRSRLFKLFVFLFFVFSVASAVSVYVVHYQESMEEDISENVLGVRNPTGVPYIINLPPLVVREGEVYEYRVRVLDSDTEIEGLELEYMEGPEWLNLEGFVLKGVAPSASRGTYKIVLKVSDGYNSSTKEDYILVEESLEDVE
ncbi:MAG TPA: hypothetical protein P5311_00130 [Candidatus Dojkabacteria bacterium]|nr:hypothetical protein [Candidatus Dojkabacteria bacterium]